LFHLIFFFLLLEAAASMESGEEDESRFAYTCNYNLIILKLQRDFNFIGDL